MTNDLKLIEQDLHRQLTNDEAAYVLRNGGKAFIEQYLGWDQDYYVAYRRLIDLLVTFFTKPEPEFSELYRSKDHDKAYVLLKLLEAKMESMDENKFNFDNEAKDEECQEEKCDCKCKENCDACPYGVPEEGTSNEELYTLSRFVQIKRVIDLILSSNIEKHWVDLYEEADVNHIALIEYATDVINSDEEVNIDEVVSDGMDVLKDYVVKYIAEKLLKTGEKLELPLDVMNEICEYLFENEKNISVKIVNNNIECKRI